MERTELQGREIVKVEFMDTTGYMRSLSRHEGFWTKRIESRPDLFHVYEVDADTTAYATIDTLGAVTGVVVMTFAPEKELVCTERTELQGREVVKAEMVTYTGEITDIDLSGRIWGGWVEMITGGPELLQVYELDETQTVYGLREKFSGHIYGALVLTTAPDQQDETQDETEAQPVPVPSTSVPCVVIGAPGYADFIGTLVYTADTFRKAVVKSVIEGKEDLFVVPLDNVICLDGSTELIEFDPADWAYAAQQAADNEFRFGKADKTHAAVAAYLASLEAEDRRAVMRLAIQVAYHRTGVTPYE